MEKNIDIVKTKDIQSVKATGVIRAKGNVEANTLKKKKDYKSLIHHTLNTIQSTLYNIDCRNIDSEMSRKKVKDILTQANYSENSSIYFHRIKETLAEMLVKVESPFSIDSFQLLKGAAPETTYGILLEIIEILSRVFPLSSSKDDA